MFLLDLLIECSNTYPKFLGWSIIALYVIVFLWCMFIYTPIERWYIAMVISTIISVLTFFILLSIIGGIDIVIIFITKVFNMVAGG